MLLLIRRREDQVFLLTQNPGLLLYQLLHSDSLLDTTMIEGTNFPRKKHVQVACCGSGEALLGLSSSVTGNKKPLVILSLTLGLQVVLCKSTMPLTVFLAHDNPACQGRLYLFLYCSQENPAHKTLPDMNHMWL